MDSFPERAAFTVNQFLLWANTSRTTFYKEVSAGRIPIRKLGKRTLVLREDAERWLANLPVKTEGKTGQW